MIDDVLAETNFKAGASMSDTAQNMLITVGEAAFARELRGAAVPIVVLFRSPVCAACRSLVPSLAHLAAQYAGQVVVLSINVERNPFVAEQYGVAAVPTVLVLRDGEETARIVGFAPAALLELFFAQVVANQLAPGLPWSPTEQAYEDAVIIPLLDDVGWAYRRQVVCPVQARKPARGRVDILAYDNTASEPLTVFEAKRRIATSAALQQASAQARRYAEAFELGSFVVAAPAGMWIYRLARGQSRLIQSFSSLELATHPEIVKHALQQVRAAR